MSNQEKFSMTYDPSIREDIPFPKPKVLEEAKRLIKTPEFKKHFGVENLNGTKKK